MDAHDETDPEENENETEELKMKKKLEFNTVKSCNLEQFLNNLEAIEEYFEEKNDFLPYEGIEEKMEILQVK